MLTSDHFTRMNLCLIQICSTTATTANLYSLYVASEFIEM